MAPQESATLVMANVNCQRWMPLYFRGTGRQSRYASLSLRKTGGAGTGFPSRQWGVDALFLQKGGSISIRLLVVEHW